MGAERTHEEHLDVYNFKKKNEEGSAGMEQEKENLTVENEG